MNMDILGAELANPDYKNATTESETRTLGGGKRKYQLDILDAFEHHIPAFNMLTKPSGSGKSFEQAALAVRDIENTGRKQLILVPQVHIAAGFFREDGETISFTIRGKEYKAAVLPEYNFCKRSSIKRLVQWLLAPAAELAKSCSADNVAGGLIAMTSYRAFVIAFSKMSHAEKFEACSNLHIRPDESHHVAMGEVEAEDDRNKIGTALKFLVENHEHYSGITLSTATNFRSDNKCIVRPEMLKKFEHYRLSFLDHFNNTGIEKFRVEILTDIKSDPTDCIVNQLCAEPDEYHIVVVPPRNAGWRSLKVDPSRGVNELVKNIKDKWLADHGTECRLLNLVQQEERKKRKKYLLAEPKAYDEDKMPEFDVIITCMLGREGTDWCPASRLHVTYVEGSITLAVQTLGRLLRKFGNKTDIVARYYYPKFPEPEEGLTKAELLNDRKNALLFMTQVDDLFFPIALEEVDKSSSSGEHKETVTLCDVIGETKYIQMKTDFFSQAIDAVLTTLNADALGSIIDGVLEEYVPPEYWQQGRRVLMQMYARRANTRYQGVNVDFIREQDFPTLLEELSLDEKTLVCHGGDIGQIKQLGAIAKTLFDEKVEKLKSYNVQTIEGVKKLPPDMRNFFNQMWRRRRDAQQLCMGAANS